MDTREELIQALYEGGRTRAWSNDPVSFSAFTMKKRLDEGITGSQQEIIRKWESQILTVAREEMAHLGTVCNLVSAIGGSPHFRRPNFPQVADKYYPFSFTLARFSDESLYRFIRFELPKGEELPQPPYFRDPLLRKINNDLLLRLLNISPDPLEYDYVGELYRKIREGYNTIPEQNLFIGPKSGQEYEIWSRRISILQVFNRETVIRQSIPS